MRNQLQLYLQLSLLGMVLTFIILTLIHATNARTTSTKLSSDTSEVKSTLAVIRHYEFDANTWLVCHNNKAGYEFRYPSDWSVYGDGSTDEGPNTARTTPCVGYGVSLQDDAHRAPEALTRLSRPGVAIRVDSAYPEPCRNRFPPSSRWISNLLIGNVLFCKLLELDGQVRYIGNHGKYTYTIYPNSISRGTFDSILSTFRFLSVPE